MNEKFAEKHQYELDTIIIGIIQMMDDYVTDRKEIDKLKDIEIRFLISHILDGVFYSAVNNVFGTFATDNTKLSEEFNKYIQGSTNLKKLAEVYVDKDYIPLINLYFSLPKIMKEIREKL